MVACFVLGIIYEFIKSYREYWMRGAFQTVRYNQVENSRNKSQIEQGFEINNDSQSDQVRNLFHNFFLIFSSFIFH